MFPSCPVDFRGKKRIGILLSGWLILQELEPFPQKEEEEEEKRAPLSN